ncbi:MAG: hypothetical protein AAFV53_41995, partial [Myxococcota bacterium]
RSSPSMVNCLEMDTPSSRTIWVMGGLVVQEPIDNRYVLDQGTASGPQGSWTTKPPITQIVREDGVSISRQFTMDGDDLTVRTVVDQDDQRVEYTDVYTRIT